MAFGDVAIPFFHENGFLRKKCRVTDLWFWTRDHARDTSGDTAEDEYTFIGAPIIEGYPQRGKALKDAMRETFLNYNDYQCRSKCSDDTECGYYSLTVTKTCSNK